MGRQHLSGDFIRVTQSKTGASLEIPLHPELKGVIAKTAKNHLTFLTTQLDRPATPAGFGNWFRDACNAAGLEKLSAHGLRNAAATRLADAGCTAHEIASITGHKSLSEVQRYTAAANQRRLARGAMKRLS